MSACSWAEVKIPFQLAAEMESTLAGAAQRAWSSQTCVLQPSAVHVCNCMVVLPARATMLPNDWTSRLVVAQSKKFISAHRLHFSSARPCQLWAEMKKSFQPSSWNEIFISAQQLKWKFLLDHTARPPIIHYLSLSACPPARPGFSFEWELRAHEYRISIIWSV